MKQVSIIDSLRAFAALSVCLFHFICTTVGLEFPAMMTSFFSYGQHGVLVFFVISGFIIPWSMYYRNYRPGSMLRFMAKRLVRLEPPYLASILLILAIAFVKTRFHIGTESTEELSAARTTSIRSACWNAACDGGLIRLQFCGGKYAHGLLRPAYCLYLCYSRGKRCW